MLDINNIEGIYNKVVLALRGVSLSVPQRQVVALLGSNGAGKSTILNLVSGIKSSQRLTIEKGFIQFEGEIITNKSPASIVKLGIVQLPEGRRIFTDVTVKENLMVGAHIVKNKKVIKKRYNTVLSYFPQLTARLHFRGGYLSGGEQQMLALGRSMMSGPKLLMMDEPSLGLAPILVQEMFEIIKTINQEESTTFLLVEQNAGMALSISNYGYILENGKIVMDGPPQKLLADQDIREFYLGLNEMGTKKSYHEIKHYKRRKRWLS